MRDRGQLWFLLCPVPALLIVACAALSVPPPETAARDAYRAAKVACNAYELLPGSRHTDEMDRTCRSLRLVCAPAEDTNGGAAGE